MALTLQQTREQYPQYADVPDGKLAYGLWNTLAKPKNMAMGEFASQVGLTDDQFGEMIAFSKSVGYEPTSQTSIEGAEKSISPKATKVLQFLEGQGIGWGDEAIAAIAAAFDGKGDFKRSYKAYKAELLSNLKQYQKETPWEALGVEVAGGFASPLIFLSGPRAIERLYTVGGPLIKSTITGARAAIGGSVYGAGAAEDVESIPEEAIQGGLTSVFTSPLGTLITGTVRKLKGGSSLANGFDEMSLRPTLELAEANTTKAYKLLDEAGFKYKANDFQTAYLNALEEIDTKALTKVAGKLDPKSKDPYERALSYLNTQALKDQNLSSMENIRQTLWRFATDPKLAETDKKSVMSLYRKISEFSDDALPTDGKLKGYVQAARLASSQQQKAEAMHRAFAKAAKDAKGAKDPVSIYTKAADELLLDPKVKMHFTEEQIKQLEKFSKGNMSRDLRQLLSQFRPTANHWMFLIHGVGAVNNPLFLSFSALTLSARRSVKKEMGRKTTEMVQEAAGIPKSSELPPVGPVAAGIAGATVDQRRPELTDSLIPTLP